MKWLSFVAVNTHAGIIELDKIENATKKEQRNSGMDLVYNVMHELLGLQLIFILVEL